MDSGPRSGPVRLARHPYRAVNTRAALAFPREPRTGFVAYFSKRTEELPMFVEEAKRAFERLTGFRRPAKNALPALVRKRKPAAFRFKDDGETPNNPVLPLIVYRNAVVLDPAFDPAAVIEDIFAANGWGDSSRNGVYEFRHFHNMTHEVLGNARGQVK